ncbi:MAG TPA: nucleotidyltransferase [Chlorobaculum parvum]|uniref:Nucleotidyltransferase n=1 Tax=Chlorobaculum parvum TaxID=274539 RepID=A0A7C5DI47_9CHLB|nr:nucleotidyltransferase [Chlorobaculum parvum]
MNRAEILEIIRQYKQENSEKYGIDAIGLFGSYARDLASEESDVDIVIETREPDLYKMVHIKEDLEQRLNKPVDIVRKREKMNPYLKKRIERDAEYV